jgi:hypothetical protein
MGSRGMSGTGVPGVPDQLYRGRGAVQPLSIRMYRCTGAPFQDQNGMRGTGYLYPVYRATPPPFQALFSQESQS